MVESHIQAPNPQDVEKALRALNQRRSQQGRCAEATGQTDQDRPLDFGHDAYLAPSIVPSDPVIDQSKDIGAKEIASNRSSIGRRVAGAIIGSMVIAAVATFAWQVYSNDQTKDMIKVWWSSGHVKKLKPGSDVAVNIPAQLSDQTPATSSSAPTPVVAEAPEVLQQLQTIVSDLAALRQTVENIANKQDQASRDIASIQAAQQNVSQQISSLARATVVRATGQKIGPNLPRTQTPKQSTAATPAPLPIPPARPSPAN
jgi:hypothetical protein